MATFAYDLAGNRNAQTLANGTSAMMVYDAVSRLSSLAHTQGSTSLARFDYGYTSLSQRMWVKRDAMGSGDRYTYDLADQLNQAAIDATNPELSEAGSTASENFLYDAVGNRTISSYLSGGRGVQLDYVANALNQYTLYGTSAPSYDANGNMTSDPGSGMSYAYDARNRLLSGGTATAPAVVNAYDGLNRVAKRTVNGASAARYYDGWNLAREETIGSGPAFAWILGPRVDEPLVRLRQGTAERIYFHADALGSIVLLTNLQGQPIERYRYSAFGQLSITGGDGVTQRGESAFSNRSLFTGREWLPEAAIYDYRNRVYSAELGRFAQGDPMGFGGGDTNVYRYGGNDAINQTDPLGLWQVTIGGGFGVFGGLITFGNNGGRSNFGFIAGAATPGGVIEFNPFDVGTRSTGHAGGNNLELGIGGLATGAFGPVSASVAAEAGIRVNNGTPPELFASATGSVGIPGTPLFVTGGVEGGLAGDGSCGGSGYVRTATNPSAGGSYGFGQFGIVGIRVYNEW